MFSFGKFFSAEILSTVFKTPEKPGSPVDNIETAFPSTASWTPFLRVSNNSLTLNGMVFCTSSNKSTARVLPTV